MPYVNDASEPTKPERRRWLPAIAVALAAIGALRRGCSTRR